MRDKCGTCGLTLGPGEVHPSTDVCLFAALKVIDALKHCSCGNDSSGQCVPCGARAYAIAKGKELGVRALGRIAENWGKPS